MFLLPDLIRHFTKAQASESLCRSPRLFVVLANVLLVSACVSTGDCQEMQRPKKLIATGWDAVDSQRLLENVELMETRPFDGVVIEVHGTSRQVSGRQLKTAFAHEAWQEAWFDPAVERLRRCRFEKFTDNFVKVTANPGDVDWFDDQGWQSIVDHWRIAASIVRRSGFKGILFDPEPYTPPFAQFRYDAQPQYEQHSFDEYCDRARQRGREVMSAMVAECPDMTLLCYFMNSISLSATGNAHPRLALESMDYGLYPAFIEGWLDVAPPGVTLVDGCELAYLYNSKLQYLQAAVDIKGACQELVTPGNRAKYRSQVQVGFGIYLDAYREPASNEQDDWYVETQGRPRIEQFRHNVHAALAVSDQYVWVYGEEFRWWPTPDQRVREATWPAALPRCEEILRDARDPQLAAKAQIANRRAAGTLVNAVRNGGFGSRAMGAERDAQQHSEPSLAAGPEDNALDGWSTWQREDSSGTFSWDGNSGFTQKGAARALGVSDGCLYQSFPIEPGQRWAIRAQRKLEGKGRTSVRIRWQTPDGDWTLEELDQSIFAPLNPEGWGEVFGVVDVPAGAGRLAILLIVEGQQSKADSVWFDDVEMHRIK